MYEYLCNDRQASDTAALDAKRSDHQVFLQKIICFINYANNMLPRLSAH